MNIFLAAAFATIVICALLASAYKLGRKSLGSSSISTIQLPHDLNYEMNLVDNEGKIVLESREIHSIPTSVHKFDHSSNAMHRVRHLASDLFKGATAVPNKTIELVFKQEIQQGLVDGTYTLMKTKSGEVLADAVNTSGTIVGKGRVLQSSQVRQLAAGAFQLVSIAVAQSHLADIERSLSTLKGSLAELLSKQENEAQADISGAIDYLTEIAAYMQQLQSPIELSEQKKTVIESAIRQSHTWRNRLHSDLASLVTQVANVENKDTFGTKSTYKELKEQIEKIRPLLRRYELLLQMVSLTNLVTTYLDPSQRVFSRTIVNNHGWEELLLQFKNTALDKSDALLSSAVTNSDELLSFRKSDIQRLALEHFSHAAEQQSSHQLLMRTLDQNMQRLMSNDSSVRVALKFDEQGEVQDAAIIG